MESAVYYLSYLWETLLSSLNTNEGNRLEMIGSIRPAHFAVKTQPWYVVHRDVELTYSHLKNMSEISEPYERGRLCSMCLGLGQLPSDCWDRINNFGNEVIPHHYNVTELLSSARKGCHLCVLLWTSWEQNCHLSQDSNGQWFGHAESDSATLDGRIRLEFQRVKKFLRYTSVQVDEVQIGILCGEMPPKMGGRLICALTNSGFHTLSESCIPSMSDTNTGSKASMARIKAWLDICASSHPACNQGSNSLPPLPTRVIAVGGKRSKVCFLVSGIEKRGNYATLSHCWGKPNNRPLTTTDKTLAIREQGIRDKKLPKTFRNAVRICRELGIEYLWIDSLCIIQEQTTQEDWAKEAPKMGDVYGNSILTISAAVAADSSEGCFRDRLGLMLWPCSALLFGQQCHVSRSPVQEEEDGGNPDANSGPRRPLEDRAWVLQEQVLSRRSLIFTESHLVWRCASMSTSEKYPLGMPHAPNLTTDNQRLLHCIINDIVDNESEKSAIDIYTCWYRMIMNVSSRKLTYEDDRLPSIAGIAKRFAAKSNDSYHAGLWRNDLILGILWIAATLSASNTQKNTRAPSWSWASVNSQVSYLSIISAGCDAIRIPTSPLIDILEVSDPSTSAEHPFGTTSKASLKLSGTLLPVVRDSLEDSGLFLKDHGTRFAEDIENFLPDLWRFEPSAETLWYCLPVCVQHDSYYRGIRGDPRQYISSWEESLKTGCDKFARHNRVFGLVLQSVKGQQDTYIRVGACLIGRRKGTEISRISLRDRKVLVII